jgi:hypothetical protein
MISCMLILAAMVMIGVPGINHTRVRIQRETCKVLLHRIEAAKIAFQVENELASNKLKNGQVITLEQLLEHGKMLKEPPVFPVDGDLDVGGVGEPVTFNFPGFGAILSTANQAP